MAWFIFDLDGTLACDEHRKHLLQGKTKKFDEYFDLCHLDTPKAATVQMFKDLVYLGHDCEIWTGRSDQVREKTELWLENIAGINSQRLIHMRRQHDHTIDTKLKEQWLFKAVENRRIFNKYKVPYLDEWPQACFEDRSRVVDMWRSHDITCYHVERGDF